MTLLSQYARIARDSARGGRQLANRMAGRVSDNRVIDRVHDGQDYLLVNFFRPYGVTILYVTFAFVFFYFGFQKPSPAESPVRVPLGDFFPVFGIPVDLGMLFVGTYEMFLGLLLLFRQLRVAFWLFIPHQLVTFLSLVIIPFVAFQDPYLTMLGQTIPVVPTGYGEFVIKNVVFVAGFMLLASIELGSDTADETEVSDS